MDITMHTIAHIRTDLPEKFGVPRQSGLVPQLQGTIVFEPDYRNPDALRGLEGFSHLWLIFRFHRAEREGWSPTVRPPRLGGNRRMGVFATRSPFRPNNLGLSCVKLEGVCRDEKLGPVIRVSGADLVDGTPILDISRTCPMPTAQGMPPGALPTPWRRSPWRWSATRRCWRVWRRSSGRGLWACWPVTPGPGTRRTRSGYTAWPSPGKM